jgi:YHS domain-containing protein
MSKFILKIMKLPNISKTINAVIIISSFFLFSSCMMLSPNHFTGTHTSTDHFYNEAVDPVCGRSFKSNQSTLSYQYLNKNYYFDTEECLSHFKQTPDNYLQKNQQNHRNGNHNGLLWGLGAVVMVGMMVLMVF